MPFFTVEHQVFVITRITTPEAPARTKEVTLGEFLFCSKILLN